MSGKAWPIKERKPVRPLKHLVIIDGEGLLHTAFHKFSGLKSTDGKPSGAIFGFFRLLHAYMVRFYPLYVVIVFDNGRSELRMKLNPHYKEHRKNISIDYESLQSQKKVILKMLSYLRLPYVFDKKNVNDYEGDDYITYTLKKWFPKAHPELLKGMRYILITSDKDFNQLLRTEIVKIYNQRKDQIVSERNCLEIFGYSAKETIDWLCMVGDKSDDIKGIPGIGPVKARRILQEYGTFSNYLKQNPNDEYQAIYERNQKLINLNWWIDNVPMNKFPLKEYKDDIIRYKAFKRVCIDYSFSSFLKEEFIQPFKDYHIK